MLNFGASKSRVKGGPGPPGPPLDPHLVIVKYRAITQMMLQITLRCVITFHLGKENTQSTYNLPELSIIQFLLSRTFAPWWGLRTRFHD